MKFDKAKHKVFHLGLGKPKHKDSLGEECLESSLEKDLRMSVDRKLNMA